MEQVEGRSHPLPVSAPVRVRDRLRGAADGPVPVLHHGPEAVYVEVGGRAVGVLAAGAALVPNALRTRTEVLPWDRPEARMSAGVLHLDGRPLPVGRVVDVRVPRVRADACPAGIAAAPRVDGDPLPDVLDAAAVRRLVGRGPGLTPLGDDVVSGWLVTARALGVATPEVDDAVRSGLDRTTLLSATLLECALHGEALPQLGGYLVSLGTTSERNAATALGRVGATSGAGLLAGARLALRQLTSRGVLVA